MSDKDLAKAISETIKLSNLATLPPHQGTGKDGASTRKPDPKKIHDKLFVFHQPRSMESEYFRFLKSKLEHHFGDPHNTDEGRVILITGATSRTGKTICALNLTLSFAKAYGSRTLFLNGDSRHPASQIYLGLGKKVLPGLSDVLTLQQRAGSVLINTGLSDMVYFPSGDFSDMFVDQLRSEELSILLNSFRKRFRYIIIDTPPAFPMPEAGILAHHCDGVLLVLGAGRDGIVQLTQCLEALPEARLLGIILNGVKFTPTDRYYTGAYGYYAKKDQ